MFLYIFCCRQQLEVISPEMSDRLFQSCMDMLDELTRDVFGNYVIIYSFKIANIFKEMLT